MRNLTILTAIFLGVFYSLGQENKTDTIDGTQPIGQKSFQTKATFMSSAFQLKKGNKLMTFHIFGPEFEFGLSDKLSLQVNTTWILSPAVISAKYQLFSRRKSHFALQGIVGTSGFLNNWKGYTGILNGIYSFGTEKSNVSISAGIGIFQSGDRINYSGGEGTYYVDTTVAWLDNNDDINQFSSYENHFGPVFSISGKHDIGENVSFIYDAIYKFFNVDLFKVQFDSFDFSEVPQAWLDDSSWGHSSKTVSSSREKRTFLMVSPGLRFRFADNVAFQFTLGGIIWIDDNDTKLLPAPSVSLMVGF